MGRYQIADLQVEMTLTGRTRKQAQAYRVTPKGEPDIQLVCDVRKIMTENPHITDPDMAQYLGTGAIFARKLLNFDGSYLHASAVVLDGKAYLFSAPCGTGKSTHTEKWCRLFGAAYLNDDKPALRVIDGVFMAYGTPWSGKHDLSQPIGVPLGGIAFLKRGEQNRICRMDTVMAVAHFMNQSLWQLSTEEAMEKQLDLTDRLLRSVPVWELTCRNDDEAAEISRAAMTGAAL